MGEHRGRYWVTWSAVPGKPEKTAAQADTPVGKIMVDCALTYWHFARRWSITLEGERIADDLRGFGAAKIAAAREVRRRLGGMWG